MTEKPVIGITKPTRGDNLAYGAIWLAVRMAGGEPLRVTARHPHTDKWISGFVLGGGSDVYPELYDGQPHPEGDYDRERDRMERFWAQRARDERLPVLGICRGAQLLNVVNGGTLHANIAEAFPDVDYPSTLPGHIFYRKTIEIDGGSLLRRIIGARKRRVNSIHKQAIDKVGHGLVATAREANGLIQAIEDPESDFYLGVQFHPEFLTYRKGDMRIFKALVEAARQRDEARRSAIGDAPPPHYSPPQFIDEAAEFRSD
ncbi:gamma-glutamyl-gamma-aminobutyrate hydrolase family protein [Hyphococcus sp.]|uniref:gamma-glutamyl-gamma-aminobutyrate hydrolase family protein n=1 Tax=Hyphococcus sp. TaxID=2038636 RepID=UPI0035C6AC29